MNGNYLLSTYRKGQIKNTQKNSLLPSAPSVSLIPRLTQKDNQLSVSFKVGTDKLFVVKKLDDFCSQVHNSETVKYGTSTVISHKLQDFTEKSQKWIRFIDQIVREEARFVNKIEASGTYLPKKFNVGSSLGAVWLAPGTAFMKICRRTKLSLKINLILPQKRKPSFIVLLEIPGSPCRFWMLPKITTSLTVSL